MTIAAHPRPVVVVSLSSRREASLEKKRKNNKKKIEKKNEVLTGIDSLFATTSPREG